MIDLGLTRAEENAFNAQLLKSHFVAIEADLYDAEEERIDSLNDGDLQVISGDVQVDRTAEVSRTLNLELVDLTGGFAFDSSSPKRGVIYADRMIGVRYCVWVEEVIRDWVDVPVFYGPITGYSQSAETISLEAMGMEYLLQAPHYVTRGYTIPRKTRLDDAIKRVGRQAGHNRFDIPDMAQRLDRARVVEPDDVPWKLIDDRAKTKTIKHKADEPKKGEKAKKDDVSGSGGSVETERYIGGLAHQGDRERIVFMNGRGRLTVRRARQPIAWVFDDEQLLTDPDITFDLEGFVNHVVCDGVEPKGKGKKAARASVSLRKSHPLSPQSLKRNGQPRFMTAFINGKGLKTDRECAERAREVLRERAESSTEATFSTLVIPQLEEGDRVRVRDSAAPESVFTADQFSIPLTEADGMSFGQTKRISQTRKRAKGRVRSTFTSKRRFQQ